MSKCLPCAKCLENCDDTSACIDQYINNVINESITNNFCTAAIKCVNDNLDDIEFCPIVYDCLKSLPGYTDTGTIFLTAVDNILTWIDLTSIGSNVVVESGNCIDVSGTGSSLDPLIFDLNESCFKALFSAGDCLNYNVLTGEFSLDEDCIQDLIGLTFIDTTTVNFTYNDLLGQVSADVNVSADLDNGLEIHVDGLYVNLNPRSVELDYGGVVTWLQDYDFYVSPAGYHINGIAYASPEAYITLSPSDPSLDRFDIVYLDSDATVKVLEGEPSLTPSEPGLDIGLELGLSSIFIEAGSSSPVDVVQECFESLWIATGSDADINGSSVAGLCVSAIGYEATNADNGDYLLLDRGISFDITNTYNIITFRIKPKSDWGNDTSINHRLKFQFQLAGTAVGSAVYMGNGAFNFNSTSLTCQIISIPLVQFGIAPSAAVDQLKVTVVSELNPPTYPFGWYMDGMCIQGGIFGAVESDDIHNQYFGPQKPGRYWIDTNARIDGYVTSPQRIGTSDNFYNATEKFGWGAFADNNAATVVGFLAEGHGNDGSVAIGTQSYSNSGVAVGYLSHAERGVAIGGTQTGSGGVAVGGGSQSLALAATAVGGGATVTGPNSISIGYGTTVNSYAGLAVGVYSAVNHNYSSAYGISAKTTAQRQLVFGGDDTLSDVGFTSMYFGTGVTSIFNADRFWSITGSEGTNIGGNKWTFAGAAGTGAGLSGPFEWQTSDPTVSGTTLQSWTTKMALNSNTKGLYLDNIRFQEDEGTDVVASNNLLLGTGNSFTITGSTTINAITNTNWQDGAVIRLHLTGSPTLKNNTAGGAGTTSLRLAGAVDFVVSGYTVLELELKDGFWNEVGRTSSTGGGLGTLVSADNALSLSTSTNVQWGATAAGLSPLLHNTFVDVDDYELKFIDADDFWIHNSDFQITDALQNSNRTASFRGGSRQITDYAQLTSGILARMQLGSDGTSTTGTFLGIQIIDNTGTKSGGLAGNLTAGVTLSTSFTGTVNSIVLTPVSGMQFNQTTGNYIVNNLTNLSTQDRLIGQYSSSHQLGYITIGTGLSLAAGVLTGTGVTGITADNGLTATTATNVQLGGTTVGSAPLLHNTFIDADIYTLDIRGTGFPSLQVINNSSFAITCTGGTAGIWAITGGGTAVIANATSGYAFNMTVNPASTNTVVPVGFLSRTTSGGVGANGIGMSLDFSVAESLSSSSTTNKLISKWVDATFATRTSQLDITGFGTGSSNTIMSAYGSGVVGIGISSAYTGTRLEVVDNSLAGASMVKLTSTSTAAASGANKLLEITASGANANINQSTYGAFINNTHTGTGSTTVGIFVNASGGTANTALQATSTGQAITASSTGNNAGQFITTADTASIDAENPNNGTSAFAARLVRYPTSTNTVKEVLRINRQVGSGVGANGVGASIGFYLATDSVAGSETFANEIISKYTSVTDGAQTSELSFTGVNGGSSNILLTISGAGVFTLTQGLSNYADDTAAAVGGIPVNGLYRTASAVKIRVS